MKKRQPNLREEKNLWKKGYKKVACLDEAGRGALVGPVIAAAVYLNFKFKHLLKLSESDFNNIKDSKKLTAKKREEIYKILTKNPQIQWGIGMVSEKVIDKINIKNAAELAMEKAIKKLKHRPDFLIIDGNHINSKKLKAKSYKLIIKADEKVFSCCAASIIAKVTRDRIMQRYHKKYPKYGFNKHKGYPTKFHRKMLKKYGPCKIHRKTFRPIRKVC